jgi:hypothetical protein
MVVAVMVVAARAAQLALPAACSGRGASEPLPLSSTIRLAQRIAKDRAQRALPNLANLATCAMVTMPPERREMSWSDLERLVVDAETSHVLMQTLSQCRSRNELLQTARRLGYRVTKGDLRHAWLQHLQGAEAQELSQPQPAARRR